MNTEETRELLEKIAAAEKKQNKLLMIAAGACCGLFLVILITALVLVPRAVHTLGLADEAAEELQTAVSEARTAIDGITDLADTAESSLDETSVLVQNASRVLEDNAEGLSQVIENFNSVDFEHLNKAISDLSDVVEPLANFAKMFG